MGYHRAGFDVLGVDIKPQPHYPFEFVQHDALILLQSLDPGDHFAAIHASPPCQAFTQSALSWRRLGKKYPDLLTPSRPLLEATGLPWVIENTPGAPMRADYVLCGCMFDLRVSGMELRRERWFETSWNGHQFTGPCQHYGPAISVVGHGTPSWVRKKLGRNPTIAEYRAAMGIDWMNRDELSQAIPPAYTEWIGRQLLEHLGTEAA